MLNLFRTTAETMNDQMCSILDQYRSPFIELINTRIHHVYLELTQIYKKIKTKKN